jgi:transmembrane sensor
MSANPSVSPSSDPVETAASQWLARRDRGLSASEQDAYLQWLREDARHGPAITRLEKVWGILDQLTEWRPEHSLQPNPDLLAPRKRGRVYWLSTAAFAAAAAVALLLFVDSPKPATPQHRQAIIHPGPERMALEDGSVIELNTGAKVDVHFTPAERRVKLVRGEAHFTVAKNPNRPFIVSADKVAVRAVGTAFSVSLDQREVSVLVTEGKVQVAERPKQVTGDGEPGAESLAPGSELPAPNPVAYLTAGQQAVINLAADTALAPAVQDVTPAQVERSLSWQGMRLEFVDMPLGDVVAEFNRYNRRQLVVEDAATAAILVGGNFRADNVETFVRLLDTGFGVTAFPHGNEIVLRKVP